VDAVARQGRRVVLVHDLTDADIERLRDSFDRVWPIASRVADDFYHRLFAALPEARVLFHGDMDRQKHKFMSTLAMIVGTIDNAAIVSPAVETLARHHQDYGVRPEHYLVARDALMESLAHGLGAHWTPETAASWAKAYALLTDSMVGPAPR
jgi:hemoglobin-like flavoprotein